MSTDQSLDDILRALPQNRRSQVLDFARFLRWQDEHAAWQEFGRAQLARAYGPDEPEYGLDDVKPGLEA